MTNLFVRSGISFVDRSEVLTHIGNEMLAKGVAVSYTHLTLPTT